MGNCAPIYAKSRRQSDISNQEKAQEIREYLADVLSFDDLWSRFDDNGDGTIDMPEFRKLIYATLTCFCLEKCPDRPPSKEDLEPSIQNIINQVRQHVDEDNDKTITKEEFKRFCEYIEIESKNLQLEIKTKC